MGDGDDVFLSPVIVHPEGSPPAAGPFGLALHSHVPFAAMDAAGGVLGGFLFYDLVHYIAHRAIYTKDLATQLLHHGVLFGMLWLNRNTLWFNYAFPVMYAGELSTSFLNVRLVYRALGATEQWASIAFAAAFFSTRVLLFGLLVAHLVLNADALRALLSPPLRVSYRSSRALRPQPLLVGADLQGDREDPLEGEPGAEGRRQGRLIDRFARRFVSPRACERACDPHNLFSSETRTRPSVSGPASRGRAVDGDTGPWCRVKSWPSRDPA